MKRLSAVIIGLLVIAFTVFGCASPPTGPGWISLLDSAALDNFNRVGDANWRLQDGLAQADIGSKTASYLVTKNSYKDFQIRAEFWVDTAANSGIFIRCSNPEKIGADTCYEVNIFDTRPDPSFGTGAIVNVAKAGTILKAGGQWNTYEITAKGSTFTVTLNGVRTVDGAQDAKLPSGPFALQWGAGVVKFRKVQIKPL
jgi:hypothetical protein